MSDHTLLEGILPSLPTKESVQTTRVTLETLRKRVLAIYYGGPLLSLTFLLFWFEWTSFVSLQFAFCLIVYDGVLSYIDVNHSALLADLATTEAERAHFSMYNAVFSSLGSLSVFVSFVVWDPADVRLFQNMCVLIAIVAAIGFLICGRVLLSHCVNAKKLEPDDMISASPTPPSRSLVWAAWKLFLRQMFADKNFMSFSLLHLVQVFHCHFNSNFFPLVLTMLLGDHFSKTAQSLLLGISFTLPHINNIFFSMLVVSKGAYAVIRGLLLVKVLLAALMLLSGPSAVWLLCFFIASNRIFTEGTCKLLGLVISDLVDEDFVKRHRPHALSALIFGTAALLSKPGQTFAPLLGTSWLSDTRDDPVAMRTSVFWLLVVVPLVCGSIQLLAWSRFTLHGSYLHRIQNQMTKHSYGDSHAL